ncbi:MAG: FkbM family methyltransferase, partial [Patescibacteria group bacterium]
MNQKDVVISSALVLGVYEPFQIEVFRSLVDSGMAVVDIGANVGLYTVIAAKKARKVFSFEPESENFILLNKNVWENG